MTVNSSDKLVNDYFSCVRRRNHWLPPYSMQICVECLYKFFLKTRKDATRATSTSIYLVINQGWRWLGHDSRTYVRVLRAPVGDGETGSQERGPCDCRRYGRRGPYLAEIAIQLNLTIGLRWWHEYGSGYIPLKIAVLVEWCWWSVFISCRVYKARRGGRGRAVRTAKLPQPPFGDVTKTGSPFVTPAGCITNFIT